MFNNFRFDTGSFLIGLVSGLLIWFIATRFRVAFPSIKAFVSANIKRIQETATGGITRYLRQVVLKKAQKNHLASSLFSLDEISIPAKFLAPVIENEMSNAPGESFIPKILPMMHSCPEMASQYNWPSVSLEQALQNKANIAIIGQPGSGKTVALSMLAAKLARKDNSLGDLANLIPLLIHKNDLGNSDDVDFLDAIIQSFTRRAPFFIKSQISGFLTVLARNGDAIVLLDGFDQINPAESTRLIKSLSTFLKKHPKVQVVVTGSPDFLDGLLNIGFHPLTIAAWDIDDRTAFLNKWNSKWKESIEPQIKRQVPAFSNDMMLLENWLTLDFPHMTPLDWTLRVWSVYAGDACGSSPISSLDAYINRTSAQVVPKSALARIAFECWKSQTGTISQPQIDLILSSINISETQLPDKTQAPAPEGQNENQPPQAQKKADKKASSGGKIISSLLASGILVPADEAGVTFVHPVVMGYLGSLAFDEDLSEFTQEGVSPKTECLVHYLAAQKKAEGLVTDLIEHQDPPFYFNLLMIGRWLKDVPLNLEWRSKLMRQIIKIITEPSLDFALKANLVSALTAANDPAVSTLFRQLLLSPDEKIRILAVLGCGAIQDIKSIHEIALLIKDKSLNVQIAAALALGAVRNPAALEYISGAFLEGEETIKQAAAEALSWKGDEGIEVLKRGFNTDDVLMRRAVVFGLSNLKSEWAHQMIEHIAVEDGQWVVRNAAVQALESFNKPSSNIPSRLIPPYQAPWLIAFAAKQGTGVVPGKFPLEILISALDNGTIEERLSSLTYLRLISSEDVVRKISQIVSVEHGIIKEAAMLALWYFKVSGVKIPVY